MEDAWRHNPGHRRWLWGQAEALLAFYERRVRDPAGGFYALDARGLPLPDPARPVVATARMVHCFSAALALGRPGATGLVDHGLRALRDLHRDAEHGGFGWVAGPPGVANQRKEAYGHAFVLLGAASATAVCRPGARALLDEAGAVLLDRFFDAGQGALVDAFPVDWSRADPYRGANANMHAVEALMAAAEATGDARYTAAALRVAETLIGRHAAAAGWRVPEHYTEDWAVDPDYNREDPEHLYRPYGMTPGHWMEWARLLLGLRHLAAPEPDWLLDAARRLFDRALADAWDPTTGGFAYTVDFEGAPLNRDRYHWVHAEAVAAAAQLAELTGEEAYERAYRDGWDFIAERLIDHAHGGWHHVLDPEGTPRDVPGAVRGKPDLYHALQACLLPLTPPGPGLLAGLAAGVPRP